MRVETWTLSSLNWGENVYRVRTASQRVEKEIAALPSSVRDRVLEAMQKLAEDPRPRGARKLMGEMGGAWRIRVGDYRVIYDVVDEEQVVIILATLHRRQAYRR